MKNVLKNTANRVDQMEERISELVDKNLEMIRVEEEREDFFKSEKTLQELSDCIKRANLRLMDIPKGEERKKGAENLFREITAEKFSNLRKELDIQVHEANKTPYYLKTKITSKSHYIKTVKKSMTKHFKGNWRKTKQNPSYLQSNSHKAMSIFLSRNSIVQERVEGHIQTIKRFKLPDKNTLSSSYISDMEKYGIPKQTKAEGVHHH